MHILSSKLNFADIPYEVEKNLENALKEDNNWKSVASFIQDWFAEDPVLTSADIREMELKGSPARDLMDKFIQLYFTVEDVQFVLTKSGLTKIGNLLITNVPVNFGYPKEDQEVAVQLGHPYEMEVRLFGSPYPDLQWYCNDVPLPGKNENKLLLRQVCKENAGIYQCKAVQNIQGKLEEFWSHSISLQTKRAKPTIVHGKDLKDVTLEANKDLFLKFEVLADPEPVYTWYKNGKEIQKSSSCIFKIYGVGVADTGMYFCEAENTEGICRSAESTVTVSQPCTAPDVPVIIRHPEIRSSYALRDTVNLYYEVRCRHAVQFLCYINGRNLNDINRFGTTAVSDKVGDYTHILNLHYEVNKEDWCHGNQGPIVICVEAHSQGYCVPSSTIIEVKGTPLNQQLTARNKWALLIANTDYSSEHVLKTPAQDMKSFSSALTSLGFRCMTCCNVTKSEFMAILSLFLSYCQNGDYVVFYYAGHGFHHRGVDYILPLHFEKKGMWVNEVEEQACITTTEVINRFQRSDPALIFYVHDTCRVTRIAKDFQEQETHRDAKGNLCLLNATSENYNTYEEPDSGSLLMQELKTLITKKIPVTALCDRVLKAFRNHMIDEDGNGPQVPQSVCDLQYDFSLTDPAAPLPQDYHTVLKKWEEMSNVGGTKEEVVKVGNNVMEVKIKCEQEGYPMIISNSIDVVIRITSKNSGDVTTGEEGLVVTVTPSTSDAEVIEKVTDNPIRCTITNLQALDNDLCVAVTFTKEEDIVGECRFNFGTPSLCNITNNIRNEL
ncbi:mucosa-associated lymphoid tissue lymphoma translocation protein 1-like [Palaemon carinicauda]|uniref:mucosa-associated lymphoid tissue lymphoma translocation protein 1-like n=1 Tax=Palaemon carinicauda TaxID=392227 RepID=UPI0035B61CCA